MENNNFDDEKKTILIVDDEQKIVDLLVHNLTREGYNTIEANDGQNFFYMWNHQECHLKQ